MTFAITVFTSAFLLFQVQPIIARYILPWYGGSPAVWTTCMLFFQLGLLLGYTYAHVLATYLSTKKQAIVHMGALVLSLVLLPITPSEALRPDGTGSPTFGILFLLVSTVGLPYILISATGPLLQHWFAARFPGKSPYRLYALSNVASLLALLTYPFLFERALDLPHQTVFWSCGYGLFIVACGVSAFVLVRFESAKQEAERKPKKGKAAANEAKSKSTLTMSQILLWLGLSATGSILLLAITNKLTEDVAVIAFLWILPLSLYLITFIIAFDSPRWYHRGFWVSGLLLLVPAVVYLITGGLSVGSEQLMIVMAVYLAVMFFGCMVCHGELVRLKPEPDRLTAFYLVVSLGGALGGLFVGVLCPNTFSGFWELHIGILMALALPGIAITKSLDWSVRPTLKRGLGALVLAGTLASATLFAKDIAKTEDGVLVTKRNFYGIIRVIEADKGDEYHRYEFYHGRIHHGQQFRSKKRIDDPTSYYGPDSGVGIAIRKHPKRVARNENPNTNMPGLHVGVIGLGVGTLVTFARRRDRFRMYEINPDVLEFARSFFGFLRRSEGSIETVVGDGRVSLERELKETGSHAFDVLAIDAFSGDAIPVHLMTLQAGTLYKKHLAEGGILAFHISNRFVDLKPVALALAKELDMEVLRISSDKDSSKGTKDAEWILMTNNGEFTSSEYVKESRKRRPWHPSDWPAKDDPAVLWTDHYSSVVSLLK